MTIQQINQFIVNITGETFIQVLDNGDLHVPFFVLDKMSDSQWCQLRTASHDVTDKGVVFYA